MTLAPLIAGSAGRPTLSFELFPPRSDAARDALWDTVSELVCAGPDFVSVTYGAAGGTRDRSRELVTHLLSATPVPAMAHLTCVGCSRRQVAELAHEFLDAGVRNLLALRGDPPADAGRVPPPDGVPTACDLVELLQVAERRRLVVRGRDRPPDEGPLSIAVAAFPRARDADEFAVLRAKQEAGAHFAICQVTFSADEYATFVRRARAAGVTLPLLPGIAAAADPRRLRRIGELSGVHPPEQLLSALDTDDPVARRRSATAFTSGLAEGLLDAGAPGLHLYTFNAAQPALDLLDRLDLPRSDPARSAGGTASRPDDDRAAAVGGRR